MNTLNMVPTSNLETSLSLVRRFAGLAKPYSSWVAAQAPSGEVSFARSQVLRILHESGASPMSALSKALGVTKRNITSLVDGLEQDGLVQREASPTDRRSIIIRPTTAGSRIGCEMSETHETRVAALFDNLSLADQTKLMSLLGKIEEGLRLRGFLE